MNTPSKRPLPPLTLLAFAWSTICPIALQPFVTMLHSKVAQTAHPRQALIHLVSDNLFALRFVLYACALGAPLVAIYCARAKTRDPVLAALVTVLAVSSTALTVMTLLSSAVAIG